MTSPGLWLHQGQDRVVDILPGGKRQYTEEKSLHAMITDCANCEEGKRVARQECCFREMASGRR